MQSILRQHWKNTNINCRTLAQKPIFTHVIFFIITSTLYSHGSIEVKRLLVGFVITVGKIMLHCALSHLTLCSLEPYTVLYFKKTERFWGIT